MLKSESCVRVILGTLVTAALLSTQLGRVQCIDVRIQPAGQVVKPVGSSVIFLCSLVDGASLSADASIQLQWIDNNDREVTVKTGRRYIEQVSLTHVKLYLSDIGESDEGQYSCVARVDDKRFVKNVQLTIFEEISFVDTPTTQSLSLGSSSLIRCTVTGKPVPTVSWKFAGRRIVSGGRYSIESDGLRITDVSYADAGRYVCRATVDADGRYEDRQIEVSVHDTATGRRANFDRLKKADIYRLLDKKFAKKTARG